MKPHFDVCIRGAGIVGRTLALLLARERLRVALVAPMAKPSAPTDASDVRAYALNAASKTLLESLRAWPDAVHTTPVRGMQVFGDAAGAVHFDAQAHGLEALAWIADVPALEGLLADAVRFQPLIETCDVTQAAAIQAELTVVCEGKNSQTRQELGIEFDTTPYHQSAIAARLHGDKPHDGIARQWFINTDTARGVERDILALLPLAGNSVALVWSVSEARAKHLLDLGEADFTAALEAASQGSLGAFSLTSSRVAWPLQLAQARRWVGQFNDLVRDKPASWALAGDAAHTVHPLSGQGLNLGLADVAQLAAVLHERQGADYWRGVGDMKLLRRYERARKADAALLRGVTDGLQQLFAHEAAPVQSLRNWGMNGFARSAVLKNWVTKKAMGL